MTANVWLITGCSSGLGKGLMLAAAARGQLVIATARKLSAIESLASDRVKLLQLDVTKPPPSLAEDAALLFGRAPNVLVNNAGYASLGSCEETTDAELRAQFDANFFGLAEVTRLLLPGIRAAADRGWIVNVGSMGSWISSPAFSAYESSKHALCTWSRSLRGEIEPFGVKVVTIEPGVVQTGIFNQASADRPAPYVRAKNVAEGDPYRGLRENVDRLLGSHLDEGADARKCADRMIDLVLGEGMARGRGVPVELVLGHDAHKLVRETLKAKLAELDQWEDVTDTIYS